MYKVKLTAAKDARLNMLPDSTGGGAPDLKQQTPSVGKDDTQPYLEKDDDYSRATKHDQEYIVNGQDYNPVSSLAVNLQTLRSPSITRECRRYNIVPSTKFFWTHFNYFFVTPTRAVQRRLQMSCLPGMIIMLLWWMTIGGFLANNWSQAFTAGVTRLTQDTAGLPPSSGTARWWGFLSLAPCMVNHNLWWGQGCQSECGAATDRQAPNTWAKLFSFCANIRL